MGFPYIVFPPLPVAQVTYGIDIFNKHASKAWRRVKPMKINTQGHAHNTVQWSVLIGYLNSN